MVDPASGTSDDGIDDTQNGRTASAAETASGFRLPDLPSVGGNVQHERQLNIGDDLLEDDEAAALRAEYAAERERRWAAEREHLEAEAKAKAAHAARVRKSHGYEAMIWLIHPDNRTNLQMLRRLTRRAQETLIEGGMLDPTNESIWVNGLTAAIEFTLLRRDERRDVSTFTVKAKEQIIARQREIDESVGIKFAAKPRSESWYQERSAKANEQDLVDFDDPAIYEMPQAKRNALGRRLGLQPSQASALSRHAIAHGDEFDPESALFWRIGSPPWLEIVNATLPPVDKVDRPVGVMLAYERDAWRLQPSLSLDMIRLVFELGGKVSPTLRNFTVPATRLDEFLARFDTRCLTRMTSNLDKSKDASDAEQVNKLLAEIRDGARQMAEWEKKAGLESADGASASALDAKKMKNVSVAPRGPSPEGWGRLYVAHESQWARFFIVTASSKPFRTKFVGGSKIPGKGTPLDSYATGTFSNGMSLGEAASVAAERNIPVLLSSEAAGTLGDGIRVERMRGRPGYLVFSQSDGYQIVSESMAGDAAIGRARRYRKEGKTVTFNAGAAEVIRQEMAKPLEYTGYLFGRQADLAASCAVGSMLNVSETGTGKTVVSGAALNELCCTVKGFRSLIVVEGRLLYQWRDTLAKGNGGLKALIPHADVRMLDGQKAIGKQIYDWDAESGDKPMVVLASLSMLETYPNDLASLPWHVLVVDEAHNYSNPRSIRHLALKKVRMQAADKAWLLTATPTGKDIRRMDVLLGLALGDESLISERMATSVAGDLADEGNATRLRYGYGKYVQRLTKKEMREHMPDVLPAKALPIKATDAEMRLFEEIRRGGVHAYIELLKLMRSIEDMEKDDPLYKGILKQIASQQGRVLGMVDTYVTACVDYEALRDSNAFLSRTVVDQGFVDEALASTPDGIPTMRSVVSKALADSTVGGVKALTFGTRVAPLHLLGAALRDRHNVPCDVVTGKTSEDEFHAAKERLWSGETRVLILSNVGNEGHNLQCASQIVHYDLPWDPDILAQRLGRAQRPGADFDYVQPHIPYILGGAMEHVAQHIAQAGLEGFQVLDNFEGVGAKESAVASQLMEMTARVAESFEQDGYDGDAARMRAASMLFGNDDA